MLANLTHAYAVSGHETEARKILDELNADARKGYVMPIFLALVHAGLNEKERAFDYLEKSYEERNTLLPTWLNCDPRFEALHAEPRSQDLLRRMKLR